MSEEIKNQENMFSEHTETEQQPTVQEPEKKAEETAVQFEHTIAKEETPAPAPTATPAQQPFVQQQFKMFLDRGGVILAEGNAAGILPKHKNAKKLPEKTDFKKGEKEFQIEHLRPPLKACRGKRRMVTGNGRSYTQSL